MRPEHDSREVPTPNLISARTLSAASLPAEAFDSRVQVLAADPNRSSPDVMETQPFFAITQRVAPTGASASAPHFRPLQVAGAESAATARMKR